MAWIWRDRIRQTVSAVASSGTGAFTLDSAPSGFAALAAGDNAGLAFFVAEEGSSWQTFIGTYTHSGTSLARTIPLDGSSGAYTNVTFTTAAEVRLDLVAQAAYMGHLGTRGAIDGCTLLYTTTSALNVRDGTVSINGKVLPFSSTTYTSGTTMLDLAGSTVNLGVDKSYFVFAYDNSGTLTFRFEEHDGTGDGLAPTWDADFGYWKAFSSGLVARRIGHIWTNSSAQIQKFVMVANGRTRSYHLTNTLGNALVSLGSQTTFTGLTITPWLSADLSSYLLMGACRCTSATRIGVITSIDGGTDLFDEFLIHAGTANIDYLVGMSPHPYTGLLHYRNFGANMNSTIWVRGTEFYV